MYLTNLREPIIVFTIEYFLCHYKGLFSASRQIFTYTFYFIFKLFEKFLEACNNVVPNLHSIYDFYHLQLSFSFPQISLTFLGLDFG